MNKMTPSTRADGVAFVGRRGRLDGTAGVAGIVEQLDGVTPYQAGLLTVSLGGTPLATFVQQRPFYTAQNIAVLEPLDAEMPTLHRLYYAMCLRANGFRYHAFGREANRTLSMIELPDAVPDWVDSSEMPSVGGMSASASDPVGLTYAAHWGRFKLGSIFDLKKGRRVTKANRTPGGTRFVGASENNNGVTDMCDLDAIFEAHCLTVPYNGNSVGVAFYQDEPFFASDDVQVLRPKDEVSRWSLLFVAAVIRYERFRFTYGYKWNLGRMKETEIRLPRTDDGTPDWKYMESVMRGLPFSAAIELTLPSAEKPDASLEAGSAA